jgi:hypothetical protein
MANFIFNIAKGKFGQYVQNVEDGNPADSRILVVPIETSGIEADATLKDYNDLAALLAAANNEQTTMGRKTLTASDITITVDDVNERLDITVGDITWTGATGNAISALLFCYIPDGNPTGGVTADSGVIPLSKHDFVVTPDGSDIVAQINAAGIQRAQD